MIQSGGSLLGLLPTLLISAFAGYRLWLLYSPDVILYPDRIEKRSLLGEWRTLSRGQIKGVGRTVYSRSGSYFDIIPQSAAERAIRLPGSSRNDPVVAAWLQGARDPEAEILAADRAAVLSDARFGATEAERAANLKTAKAVALGFTVFCFATSVWTYVSLKPYLLAIGAALAAPAIGWFLVKTFNGLILWFGKTRARPQVGLVSAAPAVAIGVAAMVHNHLYDPWLLAGIAGVAGLVAATAVFSALQSSPDIRNLAVLAGIAVGIGVFGICSTSNIAFDLDKSKVFLAPILDKHSYSGRSTSYYLTLGAWPGRRAGDLAIDGSLYNVAPVGTDVCVSDHHGALGLSWFEVNLCPGNVPRQSSTPNASNDSGDGQFYPERAQRMDVEGTVALECSVTPALTLINCRVLSEAPANYGFGAAAIARMEHGGFKLSKAPSDNSRAFRTRVRFKLAR